MSPEGKKVGARVRTLRCLAVAIAWAGLNLASSLFEARPGVSFLFPAAAVTLVAGTWIGPWAVPVVLLAHFASRWGLSVGFWPTLLFGLASAAWAGLVALLPRFGGVTAKRVLRFGVYGVVGGSLLAALMGNIVLVFMRPTGVAGFLEGLWVWWVADLAAAASLGLALVVVLTPERLLDAQDERQWRTWRSSRRDVGVAFGLLVAGWLVGKLLIVLTGGSAHWFVMVLLPAVLVAAWRGGVGSGLVANAAAAVAYVALSPPRVGNVASLMVDLASIYANLLLFTLVAVLVGVLAGTNNALLERVRFQSEAVTRGLEDAVAALAGAVQARVPDAEERIQRVVQLAWISTGQK